MVGRLSEGLGAEDWSTAPGPESGSTALWILGHVVTSRRLMARRLGAQVPEDSWEERLGMGSSGRLEAETIPSAEELVAELVRLLA